MSFIFHLPLGEQACCTSLSLVLVNIHHMILKETSHVFVWCIK